MKGDGDCEHDGAGTVAELSASKAAGMDTDMGNVSGVAEVEGETGTLFCAGGLGGLVASMSMMPARCMPASNATAEFAPHRFATLRTRYPETLSSLGPPPEPCIYPHRQFRGRPQRARRRRTSTMI